MWDLMDCGELISIRTVSSPSLGTLLEGKIMFPVLLLLFILSLFWIRTQRGVFLRKKSDWLSWRQWFVLFCKTVLHSAWLEIETFAHSCAHRWIRAFLVWQLVLFYSGRHYGARVTLAKKRYSISVCKHYSTHTCSVRALDGSKQNKTTRVCVCVCD